MGDAAAGWQQPAAVWAFVMIVATAMKNTVHSESYEAEGCLWWREVMLPTAVSDLPRQYSSLVCCCSRRVLLLRALVNVRRLVEGRCLPVLTVLPKPWAYALLKSLNILHGDLEGQCGRGTTAQPDLEELINSSALKTNMTIAPVLFRRRARRPGWRW